MRRYYQAVLDILRGGVHPREVGLAVALGLLAGFLSGWNLCLAVVLLFVLILNVPSKVFGEAWAFGWAASWTLTPVSFAFGRWMLEDSPLGSWLAPWREHPLLVLFDLDRYTVLGGGAVALMIMLPAAWLAARITGLLQSKFLEIQAAVAANTPWHGSLIVRLGCWMIFGDAAQPVPAPLVNPDWIRRRGLLLAVGLFLPAGLLGCYLAPGLATQGLLTALSTANQSEVNAAQMRLSFGDGLLEIEDLQVSDPDHPDRDRVRIGYVAAQLRPGPLLRGRLHVDRLIVEQVEADVARQHRARPYSVRLPNLDGAAVKDLFPEVETPDSIDLEAYLANWETYRQQLQRWQELLSKIEALADHMPVEAADDDAEYDPTQHVPETYLAMRQARHSFGRAEPKVWIELAALKNLAGPFGLGAQGSIELANVSSQPALTGQPTLLAIKAPEHRAELVATLNLHQSEPQHELKFHATNIELAGLVNSRSARSPLELESGTLNIVGRGWLTTEQFELAVNAQLADLRLQVTSQRHVAGLPPQLWNDGLAQLTELQTDASLHGRWSSPRLRVDADRLVQQFKEQLLAAGQVMLAKAVDEQIARGEALVDQSLAKAEAAVDRAAAKADAVVDRTTARAEHVVDNASAKVDGVVSKGEAQVAEVQQRVEQTAASVQGTLDRTQAQVTQTQDRLGQNAAQAQQSVQQWQNQMGAVGRYLQENAAAAALTSPGPSNAAPIPPTQPGPSEAHDALAETRRRGPPPLQYGDIVGAAAVEPPVPPANNPAPPADALRYPDSVRNYAAPVGPAAPLAAEVNRYPTTDARPAVENQPVNRPASFNAPPATLELGYDARRPVAATATTAAPADRNADRRSSAGAPAYPGIGMAPVTAERAPQSPTEPAQPGVAVAHKPAAPAPEADATMGTRIGNWSRGVTGKVKAIVPWPRGEAEASTSDTPAAPPRPPEKTASVTPTAPELEDAPLDTPWYKRFWR